MKKIITIFLALILVIGLVPMSAFAMGQPPQNAEAYVWEQYADYAKDNRSPKEAADAYKTAAEKYCEHIADEKFYFNSAKNCYNKAIELFNNERMFAEAFECYEAIGDVAFKCEEYQEARVAYSGAILTAESFDVDDARLGALQEKLGDVLMTFQAYRDAAFEYYHAIEKSDSSKESYADLCLKYAQALEADGLENEPEGEEQIAKAFTDAASAMVRNGLEEDAIAVMKNGAKHYEKSGDLISAQRAYASLMFEFVQVNKGDIAASLCFEMYDAYGASASAAAFFTNIAVPYYEKVEDYESAALAYEKAGDCYKEMGDTDLAKQCYKEAAEYYEKTGNTSKADAMREKAENGFAMASIIAKGNGSIVILLLMFAITISVAVWIFSRRRRSK